MTRPSGDIAARFARLASHRGSAHSDAVMPDQANSPEHARHEAQQRERSEYERRRRAKLLSAKAAHMSNTKWREVFGVLHQYGIANVEMRTVGGYVTRERVPFGENMQETTFGCFHPCWNYSDIDSIDIATDSVPELAAALASLGQLPITSTLTGLRITAYTW